MAALAYLITGNDEVSGDAETAGPPADADDPDDASAPVDDREAPSGPWTWERIPPDADVFGVGREHPLTAIVAAGPGLVAVGHDSDRNAAVVWVSEDGWEWERIEHDEDVFGGAGPQLMHDATAGGPGVVAVGTDHGDAAVWISDDGREWERIEHDEDVFGGEGRQDMHAVVEGGPGLVAVGRDRELGSAAVWVSEDDREWERIEHDEEVFGGEGPQVMVDAAVTDQAVVAVGDDRGTDGDGAVWRSADGRDWERVQAPDVLGGHGAQFVTSVAAGGPGLVAVGHDFGVSAPAAWTSADGRTWERVVRDTSDVQGDPSGLMSAVTAVGPGLVTVGQDSGVAAAWFSDDAGRWQRIEHDEDVFGGDGEQRMTAVTSFREGLVAVGADDGVGQAAVWHAK